MKTTKIRMLTSLLAVLLCCTAFSTTAFAKGVPESKESTEVMVTPTPEPTLEPGEPLSEGSDFNTRDLLYDKATNKQFITVEGRDGNIFYIIIDYDAPVNEKEEQYTTYFLNQVDEVDLEALLEEGEVAACNCVNQCVTGTVNADCPLCKINTADCVGKEVPPAEPEKPAEPTPEPEAKSGAGGPLILLLVLALAGGGVFFYIKFIKNKPKAKAPTALEDYDFYEDADEEPEETELDDNDGDEPEEDAESEAKDE